MQHGSATGAGVPGAGEAGPSLRLRALLTPVVLTAVLSTGAAAEAAPRPPPDAPTAPAPVEAAPQPEDMLADPAKGAVVDASIALGAELALGAAWYWVDVEANGKDWQYDFSLDSWYKKLVTREALRLDDNSFTFNGLLHPAAGAMYYLTARSMRWGLLPSALVSAGASTAWEFLVEFREVASLNDLIITPVSGTALGEALFQASELFRAREPTRLNRFLSHLFLGPAALNPLRPDAPAESEARWGRLRLVTGAVTGRTQRGVRPLLGLSSVTVSLPGYGQAGSERTLLGRVAFSHLRLEAEAPGLELPSLSLGAEIAWGGLLLRQVDERDGRLHGAALYLGLGTSTWVDQRRFDRRAGQGPQFDEQITASLFDARALATGYLGPFTLRFLGSIAPAFGATTAQALPSWRALHSDANLPSVWRQHGYYFGSGLAITSRWVAEVAGFEIGADLRRVRLTASRGLDRPEPDPTLAVAARDVRSRRTLWVDYGLPLLNGLRVGLVAERDSAYGTVEDQQAESEERRVQMRLLYAL